VPISRSLSAAADDADVAYYGKKKQTVRFLRVRDVWCGMQRVTCMSHIF